MTDTATKAQPLYSLGETFFVPHFEVKVKGSNLPRDVVEDVTSVTYRDTVNDFDHFDLVVNNWDADKGKLKYEPPSDSRYDGLFDPGQEIELYMGYLGDLRLMLTGEITSMEPDYPAAGGPTLAVRGLNILHRLRTEQHSCSWEKKTDSEIVQEICDNKVSKEKPGLDIDLETEPTAAAAEEQQAFVVMENQYDVVFLLERARRHDYELVLYEETDLAPMHLYFGPGKNRTLVTAYQIEWGKSLISFKPTLATSQQVGAVEVKAWNQDTDEKLIGNASWDQIVKAGPMHDWLDTISDSFAKRTERVSNRPVHTQQEADSLAVKILRQQLQHLVTGSGSVVGLPGLRAGSRIELIGLGRRFDGTWYVTETTHAIGGGGYQTSFSARLDIA